MNEANRVARNTWHKARIKGDWQRAYIRSQQGPVKPTIKITQPVMEIKPRVHLDEGCIYIIRCKDSATYKIGKSTNPACRLKSHQTSCPSELELEYYTKVWQMSHIEYAIHKLYADKCVRGEWYELSEDDIEQLKSM